METSIPFVLATTLILVVPGPTIILVISQAVTHGRKSVLPLVAGVLLGDFTAMTFSLLGLGAVMSASATLFTAFKWLGAVYLVYLGARTWKLKADDKQMVDNSSGNSSPTLLKRSFIVTALNPKSIAFFVAFLPQFIDPLKSSLPQFMMLGGIFLFLATLNATLYALFAGQLCDHLRRDNVRKWFHRCGGSALIGAGIFTAALQRNV
ncbi:MAG: LysE family translocator [Desulforhopalus sp.]